MTRQIAVRLPDGLVDALDDVVPQVHGSRSEAVRRAIELYLAWLAGERDAEVYERCPLSDSELALADDADGWSTAPPW
jgi:Arc/MetJ-type ribon-helix-helix transcriptional regulator